MAPAAPEAHVASEPQAESFQTEQTHERVFREDFMNKPIKPVRYEKTKVLLISWDEQCDELQCQSEVEALENVFVEKYHFDVFNSKLRLDTGKRAQFQLNQTLAKFVMEHDNVGTLFIIYYAGHAHTVDGALRMYPSIEAQKRESSFEGGEIVWQIAESMISDTDADIFLIFDCCSPGDVRARPSKGASPAKSRTWSPPKAEPYGVHNHRAIELLAACTADQTTRAPSPKSFTTALIWALQEMARLDRHFGTSELQQMIKKAPLFPEKQEPELLIRTKLPPQHIIIAPYSDQTINHQGTAAASVTPMPSGIQTSEDWDGNDASSTVPSIAPSVFSVQDDSSSITSLSSYAPPDVLLQAVYECVKVLTSEFGVDEMCAEALASEIVSIQRLERNLRRLLIAFGKRLKLEAPDAIGRAAGSLIGSRASFIAHKIRSSIIGDQEEKLVGLAQNESDKGQHLARFLNSLQNTEATSNGRDDQDEDSESDDEIDATQEEETSFGLDALDAVKDFIRCSAALQFLRRSVLDFLYPSFTSQLEYILTKSITLEDSERPAFGDVEILTETLVTLTTDLKSVGPHDITVCQPDCASLMDRTKIFMESATCTKWDWWPLCEPLRLSHPTARFVKWIDQCGDQQQVEVPGAYANLLGTVLEKHGNREYGNVSRPYGRTHQTGQHPTSTSLDPVQPFQMTAVTQTASTQGAASSTSTSRQGSAPAAQQTTSGNHTTSTATQERPKTSSVILCAISIGEEHKLEQLKVHETNNDDFFVELRKTYFKTRGFVRRWLYVTVFHHCNFVEIERHAEHDFEPHPEHPSLPEAPYVNEYQFKPKPPKSRPPVSAREFRRWFYYCHVGEKHSRHLCYSSRNHRHAARTGSFGTSPLGPLDYIPKRLEKLDERDPDPKPFWGLQTIERPSFFRIMVYHFFILAAPFAFWFLWLFQWGHSGDLQNASIPFSVVLVLLSAFWYPNLGQHSSWSSGAADPI